MASPSRLRPTHRDAMNGAPEFVRGIPEEDYPLDAREGKMMKCADDPYIRAEEGNNRRAARENARMFLVRSGRFVGSSGQISLAKSNRRAVHHYSPRRDHSLRGALLQGMWIGAFIQHPSATRTRGEVGRSCTRKGYLIWANHRSLKRLVWNLVNHTTPSLSPTQNGRSLCIV